MSMLSELLRHIMDLRVHLELCAHINYALQEVFSHRIAIGGSVKEGAS